MPPNNKKKKKAPANPARGFATVSVPSKPKAPEPTTAPAPATAEESKLAAPEADQQTTAEGSQAPETKAQENQLLQQYSPEDLEKHLEDAELQLLVEKYAAKCKNDAARHVTKLETERRIMRQQAASLNVFEWLPTELLDRILGLVETEECELNPQPGAKRAISEEDLYVRLWTLKETLIKLGFPEEKVDGSLRHLLHYFAGNPVPSNRDVLWNLDEILDWLALHCNPRDLPSYARTGAQLPKDSDKTLSWITGKPRLSISNSN